MTRLADRTLLGLLDAVPDAMLAVNEDGLIVLVNAQAERLFGYRREDLIGKPVELLVPIGDPNFRPYATGLQMAGRRQDGSEFPASVSVSTMVADTGLLISATIRDATEVGEVEAERVRVKTEAERVRLEAEADRVKAEGEKTEAERVRLEAEADRVKAEGEKTEAERVRLEAEVELERLGAEDERGRLEAEVERVTDKGKKTEVERGRLEAEVERKRLEGQLQQSQHMESLGQLAGGVAHDFNNLLAVISNYAALVSEELDDKEASKSDLGQILVAAERASELTRQLLAFAGRKVLQPVIFDLNQVIVAVEQLLRRTIGEHVELGISLSTDPWLVEADPGQLEQVLVNLAVNARDAMPDGGRLIIDTKNSEIDEAYTETHPGMAPGRYVRLRVSDTGSGMEQAVLDHVFEPFFTTKPRGEGTGLGLPTVFGIVAQSGGEIQLFSEPGIGTTCRVLLPTTERTPTIGRSIGRSPTEPRDLHGTETVLVVEAEAALREVACRILSRNGYVVLTSGNGPEAIALVERHTTVIDLLLTDVIMPKMLGKEVVASIQEFRPGLPVLYMSGYARPVLGPILGEEIALLETPFSEQLLLTKVRDVLDNVPLSISAGCDRGEQLAEAMGGKTGATSQTGVGNSFWVKPPVVDAPTEQPADTLQPTMVQAPFSSRARTVLLVEDNPSNVKLVERLVAGRTEVTLLVAMEGRIALELAREHQPSLILLDLNLPDMSGEEVLRRLRAEPRTSATPVVVVSADATPGQVQRVRANGAIDYLTKPFDIARLLAVIDGVGSADQPTALPEELGSIAGPLDPTIVASLHALGRDSEAGPTGIHDVVTSFLDDSWSRFADLRIAVRDGDAAGVEQLAHSLVGSSANFGARNVAEGCREIEARARAGDLGDVPMLVARLEEAFTVARTALRAEFLDGGDPSP